MLILKNKQKEMYELALLFVTTFVTSLIPLQIKSGKGFFLNFILSFSGAYLLGVTLLHVFPDLYQTSDNLQLIGIFVMIGFFLQVILESYSKGIEHGHIHIHDFGNMPYGLFIALTIHALLEGSVLNADKDHIQNIVLAIMIHKLPVAFLLGFLLFSIKLSRTKLILFLLIFALATPIGTYISSMFDVNVFGTTLNQLLIAMATGSFLHVSTTILFETSPEHKLKINKFFPAFLGGLLAVLSTLVHQH